MLKRRIGTKTSKKLAGLLVVVLLALVGLAARITYINLTEGGKYKRIVMSQAQQSYESRTIPFKRGDIRDRNGETLATSEKAYNVILDCSVVNTVVTDSNGNETTPYVEPTVKALVSKFGISESKVRDILESDDTKDSKYYILIEDVSLSDRQTWEDYLDTTSDANKDLSEEEKAERENVKGIWFEEDYVRKYPYKSQACDTIGFTLDGTTANWGIEGYYNDVLNGTDGRQYGYFSGDTDVETTIIEAEDGYNVTSTIDINIQQIIRDTLVDITEQLAGGPYFGDKAARNIGVIVMNPNNGEILGMDSTDWYDLNDPQDLTSFYSDEQISSMDTETMSENLNNIWKNFCISDAYEPGSTYKPITIANGLQTGAITNETVFTCDGGQTVADKEIHCDAYPGSHGELDIYGAIQKSCNDFMMQTAAKIGEEDFLKYQQLLHFGLKTGIDLPGEASGVVFDSDSMGEVELATSSFGQGFTCTMVQEAAAISALINGGYYYKPHVVSQITNSNGAVVQNIEPTVEARVCSQEVSDEIKKCMEGVMEDEGTGYKAKLTGYSMGGKTGTAETLPRGNGMYLLSFIGYAPADDPQVLVYVVVDEPNSDQQESNTYATGIFHNIMIDLLPYLNIYPDEDGYTEETVYNSKVVFGAGKEYNQEYYGTVDDPDSEEETTTGTADSSTDTGTSDSTTDTSTTDTSTTDNSSDTGTSDDTSETRPTQEAPASANGSNLPVPETAEEDESVTEGGNNLYTDGIENSQQ